MEPTKAKSIIAFYNIFSLELGIEDSTALRELRQMIPIIVAFIKNGTLQFVSNANFGFASAVEFLRREGLDDGLYAYLDPEAAEAKNDFEMAKILVALMYELRLVQPAVFTAYCDKLKPDENAEIGEIIDYMDDRQSWTLAPWPTVLNSSDVFTSENNKENEHSSRVATPNHRLVTDQRVVKTAFPPTRARSAAMMGSSYTFYSAAREPWSKPLRFDEDDADMGQSPAAMSLNHSSPVANVICSPRGEEITRTRQLRRQNAKLKGQLDKFGMERDTFEERCAEQTKTITGLKDHIKSLQDRINSLRADTEKMTEMAAELTELRATESALQTQLQLTKNALNEATAARKHAVFQRDSAIQRYELKVTELEQVKADYEAAIRREGESTETLEKLNGELLVEKREHATEVGQYQRKLREMQDQLDLREKTWKSRLDEKDQELFRQIQLMNEVQSSEGGSTLAQQFGEERDKDLHVAQTTIEQLRKELAARERTTSLKRAKKEEAQQQQSVHFKAPKMKSHPEKSTTLRRHAKLKKEPWEVAELEDVPMFQNDLESGFLMTIRISPLPPN